MIETSARLVIFEGPDGAGKTTLAKKLAEDIGAHYVHLGPFPRVGEGLARLYVEAMMPALLGHSAVVMDRCWMSEVPYGRAYRNGVDRIEIRSRILERLAWRCQTTVVACVPPWERIRDNFIARKGDEYLDHVSQLQLVYDYYANENFTSLPVVWTNPLSEHADAFSQWLQDEMTTERSIPHSLHHQTSGNVRGKVLLVGEKFSDVPEGQPLYQSPFSGLTGLGCSLWLARQLEDAGISERNLTWVNADQLSPHIKDYSVSVVALGGAAAKALTELGRHNYEFVQHPSHWKRFRHKELYELIPVLQSLIK
jgi:hypothetical protein